MPSYLFCGATILSDVCLPGVPSAEASPPHIICKWAKDSHPSPKLRCLVQQPLPQKAQTLSLAETDTGYILRADAIADFCISHNGREVTCHPHSRSSLETIQHLLVDHVFPRALSHQGKLILHASAVQTPYGAVAFAGASGQGKSVLAACFVAQGSPLLADDCLGIKHQGNAIWAIPSYAGIRLKPNIQAWVTPSPLYTRTTGDSVTQKNLFLASASSLSQPTPLRALFILKEPDINPLTIKVSVKPLSGSAIIFSLAKAFFQLDCQDQPRLRRAFHHWGTLASHLPTFELSYSRQPNELTLVRDMIMRTLQPASASLTC